MYENISLKIPDTNIVLNPGNIVQLGRFSSTRWVVRYGWFEFDGNRLICGWYLINKDDETIVKPITDADIIDIYVVEH